jgi:flagellar hook-length control protein FliK
MQDSLTKINIVAESASAAALLGEAENKLSQMMETSGLKLLTFQTSSQQFGSNQGKNMKHQKETKHHNEKEPKSDELNLVLSKKNEITTKDGLNLIA